jgi:mitotic spindle assembly checkpoint protein MAD1
MQSDLMFRTTELQALKRQAEILQNALILGGVDEAVLRSISEVRPTTVNTATEDTLMFENEQPKQRILQFKDNPASREQAIRQSLLDNLKKENQELIARLQQGLETSDMGDEFEQPMIPNQSFVNVQTENEQLYSTIAQKEKRILRMQQVWVTKVREYHEAVASLLGYKVDFSADGLVRLASMYADANDISFVFKSSENDQGTLKIVGANKDVYMKTLESSYNYCVVERGSIPAFLSAVTMELIDQ